MSIQSVSSVGNTSFKNNIQKATESKTAPSEIKDGKKKLALTLGGLATLGVVTAGVIYGIKTGKIGKAQQKVQEEVQEQGQKAAEKIKGLIKGDDIPFEKGKIETTTIKKHRVARDKAGKLLGDETKELKVKKVTIGKFNANYNGKDVIVEEKNIIAPNLAQTGTFAFIRDKETNELIATRCIAPYTRREIPFTRVEKSPGIHRTAIQSTDDAGNKVQETFKNGKLYSTRRIANNPDGSRRITIDYTGKSSPTIIDIAADGTRTVVQKAQYSTDLGAFDF